MEKKEGDILKTSLFLKEEYKNNIPKNKPGLYFFYDENKILLYIGKSIDIRSRIKTYFSYWTMSHLHDKFKEFVKYISVQFVEEDKDLKALEKELIKQYRPALNVQYNEEHTKRYTDEYKSRSERIEEEIWNKRIEKGYENFKL